MTTKPKPLQLLTNPDMDTRKYVCRVMNKLYDVMHQEESPQDRIDNLMSWISWAYEAGVPGLILDMNKRFLVASITEDNYTPTNPKPTKRMVPKSQDNGPQSELELDPNNTNHYIIMFSSFRYCLGRQTYVVSTMVSTLKHNWEKLHPTQKEMFKKEINEAIADNRAGSKYDVEEWEQILKLSD